MNGHLVSWQTSRPALMMRSVGRALGLNRVIAPLVNGRDYESRFQRSMLGATRPGDVVWDVGANCGLYATMFSERVGPTGHVFAFEPSAENRARLRNAVSTLPNVTVVPLALGERRASAYMEQGDDPLGATSRVRADASAGHAVSVECGDEVISSGVAGLPSVIKIDTEGYEVEVLRGLRQTLQRPTLRTLCVEVHFGLLQARNLAHGPSEIERALADAGFTMSWPDPSHIVATRRLS